MYEQLCVDISGISFAKKVMKRTLIAGLGGGLDVVNASLLYFLLENFLPNQLQLLLGSVRPLCCEAFCQSSTSDETFVWQHKPSSIVIQPTPSLSNFKFQSNLFAQSHSPSRYAETQLSSLLHLPIYYFSRQERLLQDQQHIPEKVRKQQLGQAFDSLHLDLPIFVDGGGDSLVVKPQDANQGSETTNPFEGGDAFLMDCIFNFSRQDAIQAVISVGLDVNPQEFQNNLDLLQQESIDGYFGKVNMRTLEIHLQSQTKHPMGQMLIEHILKPIQKQMKEQHGKDLLDQFLQKYFALCESILVLTPQDLQNQDSNKKYLSHTATVTYHALKGNFGIRRSFVPWEPILNKDTNERGVDVKEEHCWMYFVSVNAVESLKYKFQSTK